MPRIARELSSTEVKRLTKPGKHPVGGVTGLYLAIQPTGGRSWVLRTMAGDARREIGLGGFPDVTLAQARERARETKDKIRQGIDPVAERQAARLALKRQQARGVTFEEAAKQCHARKAQEFRNAKHAGEWLATLERYAFPSIGKLPVASIDTPQVLRVLEPIWAKIPETASRVRQRMATVFDWARAADIRSDENPAAWNGCLEHLLPQTQKARRASGKATKHHPALPVDDVPRLMALLADKDTPSARALRFAILTASRSGEVRFATWDEFDLKARNWYLPADRTKSGKPHTEPLSDAALAILEAVPEAERRGLVFPNQKGVELSDASLSKFLKDLHAADVAAGGAGFMDTVQKKIATPHGTARSTFKEWTRANNRYPDEWSELALAHVNSDKTRAAYARNELLEERRGMMAAWGSWCTDSMPGKTKVVPMRRARV